VELFSSWIDLSEKEVKRYVYVSKNRSKFIEYQKKYLQKKNPNPAPDRRFLKNKVPKGTEPSTTRSNLARKTATDQEDQNKQIDRLLEKEVLCIFCFSLNYY